jgi:tripartite-type tricarboxylate transporter receptor subunit TctC
LMKLKKIDLSMLGLMVVVIGISIIMLVDLSKFESHLAGTVGPGVFPLFILLVVIIMALWNMAKAFSPSKYKLLSPFPSGSAKGLVVSRLAEILSKELQSPVSVVTKIGEGFFSAEYAGAAAEPDGNTLTILTNEKLTAPNFLGASKILERFTPVVGLLFDPDVLVGLPQGKGGGAVWDRAALISKLGNLRIGFSYSRNFPYHLREALERKAGLIIQGLFFQDAPDMLASLEKGEIDAGICSLTHLMKNEEIGRKYEILAVMSPAPLSAFPRIPTFRQLDIDLVSGTWVGLGYPRNTEAKQIDRIASILSEPRTLAQLREEIRERREVENIQGPRDFERLLSSQKEILTDLDLNSDEKAEPDLMSLYRVLGAIGMFALVIIASPVAGFLPMAVVLLIVLSAILSPQGIRPAIPGILVTAGVVTTAIYVIFSRLFNVVFP